MPIAEQPLNKQAKQARNRKWWTACMKVVALHKIEGCASETDSIRSQRKPAWQNSGIEIFWQREVILLSGRLAARKRFMNPLISLHTTLAQL